MTNEVETIEDIKSKKTALIKKGHVKYLEFLSRNGGWATFDKYAVLLGVSRKVIEEKVKAQELITVLVNDCVCIPLFQYDDVRKAELYGVSTINKILLNKRDLGYSAASTWWLSGSVSRRTLLIKGGESLPVYNNLISQAELVGETRPKIM
ncbi:hypothetical protein [Photobacterium damselae]|uniref:hypothetical protein n=1 Tax=Photobacterium damselae TaxID=38293 RepID=UPI001F1D39E5|nr:hypothetical protein [Photobacterium damselae]UKA04861.1 hypothetical protein IHC89_21700 [Photobacterium damselae subsp. damselae]